MCSKGNPKIFSPLCKWPFSTRVYDQINPQLGRLEMTAVNKEIKINKSREYMSKLLNDLANPRIQSLENKKEETTRNCVAFFLKDAFSFFFHEEITNREDQYILLGDDVAGLLSRKLLVKFQSLLETYFYCLLTKSESAKIKIDSLLLKYSPTFTPDELLDILWVKCQSEKSGREETSQALLEKLAFKYKDLQSNPAYKKNLAFKIKIGQVRKHFEHTIPEELKEDSEIIIPDETDFFSPVGIRKFHGIYKIDLKDEMIYEFTKESAMNRNLLVYKKIKLNHLRKEFDIKHILLE